VKEEEEKSKCKNVIKQLAFTGGISSA